MFSILHIADIVTIRHFSPARLANLLKAHFSISHVLVSGITRNGTDRQYAAAKNSIQEFLIYSGIKKSEFTILPNKEDLAWGFNHFSQYLYKPIIGEKFQPYKYKILNLDNNWQILPVNTVFCSDPLGPSRNYLREIFTAAIKAVPKPPEHFIRSVFSYYPVEKWKFDREDASNNSQSLIKEYALKSQLSSVITAAQKTHLRTPYHIPAFGTDCVQIYRYKPQSRLLTMFPVEFAKEECFLGEYTTHSFR